MTDPRRFLQPQLAVVPERLVRELCVVLLRGRKDLARDGLQPTPDLLGFVATVEVLAKMAAPLAPLRWVTTHQAAERLACSDRNIRRLRELRRLRAHPSRRGFVAADDVEELAALRSEAGGSRSDTEVA